MPISALCFLVAEDHDLQRSTLVGTLWRLGAKAVHEAADGHAALRILADPARPVDVVISDLDMPGMDGMEFLRRLGETGVRISIILASVLERRLLASIATMSEAYGIKLLGVVEKPLTPAKLVPLIGLHRPAQDAPRRAAGPVLTPAEVAAGLRDGEFEPFLQPTIDLSTGRVTGAEALARWRHTRHGLLAAATFIKLIEDNALSDELTWMVLAKAAAACSAWRADGLDATVSVNLSATSLGDVTLADRVTGLVRGKGLEPRHMILEVTESAAASDVGKALENLARLRMRGFGLSIDDYGSGYSSMQQLMRVAFTEIKIDQFFVTNATQQESARVILESSIAMARKLAVTSVAEGVESQADLDLLQRLGCELAQGYFIARPMPCEAYPDWVEEWKPPGRRA